MTIRTAAARAPGAFTPVPVRARKDGWTPDRQRRFVAALARSGNVQAAAHSVGMGRGSAYALRARADAGAFRAAWDEALALAVHRLSAAALDRAIRGEATPVFYQGRKVGERRRFDNGLAMFLLRTRAPGRYAECRCGLAPDGTGQTRGDVVSGSADRGRTTPRIDRRA